MNEPLVFLNDKLIPASQAHLNIYDLGVVLGATLTEMTRTFKHVPFRLEDHIGRLYRSCKYANIKLPFSAQEMLEKTIELVTANCKLLGEDEDLGIVHFVTPGEQPLYAGSAMGTARLTPTICIHSFSLPFFAWQHLFETGAHVVTPAIRHIPPQCLDPKTKNRSRFHWHLADQQTHQVDSKAVSLLLDLDGNITECSGSNFVVVKGRTIYSPTSRNILGGVSLQTVQELGAELGLDWVEKDLQIYDVVNADEAWLTTTPYCLAPCTRINGQAVGDGKIGPLFYEIMNAWNARVGLDILSQIRASAKDR